MAAILAEIRARSEALAKEEAAKWTPEREKRVFDMLKQIKAREEARKPESLAALKESLRLIKSGEEDFQLPYLKFVHYFTDEVSDRPIKPIEENMIDAIVSEFQDLVLKTKKFRFDGKPGDWEVDAFSGQATMKLKVPLGVNCQLIRAYPLVGQRAPGLPQFGITFYQ